MSASASELTTGLVDAYRQHPERAGYDELVTADGVRPHAQGLADAIDGLGLGGLLAARTDVAHQAAADGVSVERTPWLIDPLPLPVAAQDWSTLEHGLAQRARVLDAVLVDLYSDRRLLRSGALPAAAVLAHPGFARAADGTLTADARQLLMVSSTVGRDAAGRWQVLSDHAQAPAGAGLAMATRRIVSKTMAGLHRSSDLARLRSFFLSTTAALLDAAPGGPEVPRVVLFGAGAASASAFDQGLLATLLGFPLAEADDLVVSGGRILVRAGDDLQPVDVVVRRVDDELADPLEFRGDSDVGLPGLIEAVRRGHVRVANPVGAAVLENPALSAFWPQLCRDVLGEEPVLPTPPTWWCGESAQASHALANLERLVIKPLAARGGVQHGWLLTRGEREQLAARLRAEPWAWCVQEPAELSTAPVVTASGLEPRRFMLRTFGVAVADGYRFLPGGLGRVAATATSRALSLASGSVAKDVWVPSQAPTQPSALGRDRVVLARQAAVPPRVARTLTDIGRLAERAESTARLVKVADDLLEDFGLNPDTAGGAAADALLRAVAGVTGTRRADHESRLVWLARVLLDPAEPGGVHHSVRRLTAQAEQVRDLMSVDCWSVFNRLERTLSAEWQEASGLQQVVADVLESLLAFAGIMAQSMVRDSSWAFLDAGSRLERAAHTVKLLQYALVAGTADGLAPSADLAAEAVLRAGESIITHRRRAAAGAGPATGLDSAWQLLVTDPANPRSVAFQLAELVRDLRLVDDEQLAAQAEEFAGAVVRGEEPAAGDGLAGDRALRLSQLAAELSGLRDRIGARHFVRQARRRAADSTWTVIR